MPPSLSAAFAALRRSSIPASLPTDLVRVLALAHDQPPGVAETTLGSLRYGSLVALHTEGIIDGVPETPDGVCKTLITKKGWRIIEAAAERYGPTEEEERESEAELEAARTDAAAEAQHAPSRR